MSSSIIGPLPNKSDAPSEKVKKSSAPFPNKSDAPSEKVKNSSGDLDGIENPLVNTIDRIRETIISKQKIGGGSQHLSYFRKNKIDTFDKRDKSQTSKKYSLPPENK